MPTLPQLLLRNATASQLVPPADPADWAIIDEIAQRHRLAKPKEPGLKVHGELRPDTSMHLVGDNS